MPKSTKNSRKSIKNAVKVGGVSQLKFRIEWLCWGYFDESRPLDEKEFKNPHENN